MASLSQCKTREERGRLIRSRMYRNTTSPSNNNNNNGSNDSTSRNAKKYTHAKPKYNERCGDEHKHGESDNALLSNVYGNRSLTDVKTEANEQNILPTIPTYILREGDKENPIQKSSSLKANGNTNRALRAFPDAFIVLRVQSSKTEKINQEQQDFLRKSDLLLGKYTFCYGKEDGTKSYWIDEKLLSAEDFRKWHFTGKYRIAERGCQNIQDGSTSLNKYYARMSLAFSNSIATHVMSRNNGYNIIEDPDIYNDKNDPDMEMTDGCGIISVDIVKNHVMPLLGISDPNVVPSAIQVRYGAYKGMLLVDQDDNALQKTIKFSKSMKKYNLPLHQADDNQQRLDILGYSRPKATATLNEQIILVLLGRTSVENTSNIILSLLESHLTRLHDMYNYDDKADTPDKQQQHQFRLNRLNLYLKAHNEDDHSTYTPRLLPMLLQAGIYNDYFVSRLIYQRYIDSLKKLQNKLHIEINEHARTVYCVPDFFGILEETEFYFRDSKYGVVNEKAFCVRNPCHHPFDLVQLNGVDKYPPIPSVRDIIVFSTKGNRSCASKLSGGDYDGDRVFVCWEPRLNAEISPHYEAPLHTDPRYKKKRYKDLSKPFPQHKLFTKDTTKRMKELYIKSISGDSNKLGEVSNLWKESCIQYGTRHERSLKLAKLCSYYVDMEKYGLQNEQLEPWVKANKKNPSGCKEVTLIDDIHNRIQGDIERLDTPERLYSMKSKEDRRNRNFVKLAELFHWEKYKVKADTLLKQWNKELTIIINNNDLSVLRKNEMKFELNLKHTEIIRNFDTSANNGVVLPGDFNKSLALATYMVCYDENIFLERGKPYEYCWRVAAPFLCRLHADYLEPHIAGVAHTICNENVLRGVKIL